MYKKILVLLLAIFINTSSFAFGWPKDYKPLKQEAAFGAAKENNKPIAVYYSLSYCPGCKIMDSHLRSNAVYEYLNTKINTVTVDPGADLSADQRAKIRSEWGQIVTPTIAYFSASGDFVCMQIGRFDDADKALEFWQKLVPKLTESNKSSKPRSCTSLVNTKSRA